MKKLSTTLLVLGMLFGLGACGGDSFSTDVIEDTDHTAYTVAGLFCSNDGEHAVDWKYTEQGKMTAASLAEVAEISKPVARTLNRRKLLGLYVYEGALIGTEAAGFAGWNTDAMIKGEKVSLDGGYCVKAIACDEDDLTHVMTSTQWIPDPHTACVENLTPSTLFMPTWKEEADDNGFSWSSNPVAIGGAGKYTIILGVYDAAVDESKTNSYNYGMALVKTENKDEYVVPEHDHYRLVGSINGWNKDDTAAALQLDANNTVTYTFAAEDEFQVISALTNGTGTWDGQMGASAVTLAAGLESAFDLTASNIKVVTAGTYTITVTPGNEKPVAITAAA